MLQRWRESVEYQIACTWYNAWNEVPQRHELGKALCTLSQQIYYFYTAFAVDV